MYVQLNNIWLNFEKSTMKKLESLTLYPCGSRSDSFNKSISSIILIIEGISNI